MKKVFKIIGIVIISILVIYTFFIFEESFRLSKSIDAKPLIVLSENKKENELEKIIAYNSVGFKLINQIGYSELIGPTSSNEEFVIGQEFWVFDSFMLWAWIS